MVSLQSLREARSIVRWMLVCFALSIGVAVAAPLVHPQALTLVCTTAGAVKFVAGDEGPDAGASPERMAHTLDCVLCLPAGAPPFATVAAWAPASPAALPPGTFRSATPQDTEPASARGPPARA
jgi:hypothetical protein